MTLDPAFWQERLDVLAERHEIVGATLAIGRGSDVTAVATGVLNVRTGQPATPDSLFQAGSITKVWTATLVMQLVDEGLVALDEPVRTYVPGFRVAEARQSETVTVRQLLCHTSGVDGDLFLDTGRGDDAVERFVDAMAGLTETGVQGELMSYCNAGYNLLGHVVATLRGAPWEVVLRERLLTPLGLTTAGTLPEEALTYGAAVGHVLPPGATEAAVSPLWGMYRSSGPAGLLHSTARDQLAFARMHLSDGAGLLTPASVAAMQVPQVVCPNPWQLARHWGLGWFLGDWGGQRFVGHDGGTLGQGAALRVLPDADLAVCVMANGGRSIPALVHDVCTEVGQALVAPGVRPLPRPEPDPSVVLDPARYVGTYAREGMTYVVSDLGDGRLELSHSISIPLLAGTPPTVSPLLAHTEDVLLQAVEGLPLVPVVFLEAGGRRFLHHGGRATALTS